MLRQNLNERNTGYVHEKNGKWERVIKYENVWAIWKLSQIKTIYFYGIPNHLDVNIFKCQNVFKQINDSIKENWNSGL